MKEFMEYMQSFNTVTVIVRLLLAMLAGGIIGLERGKQGRAAGMRTHILVSIGAALTALIGFYVSDMTDIISDPMRLSAQVISGIGFLGVGTILIKGRFQITGLTTAAGLWATAAIGLAFGAGFYTGGIAAFVIIVLSMTIFHRLEYRITKRYNRFGIYMEIRSDNMIKTAISDLKKSFKVSDIQVTPPRSGKTGNVGIEGNVHISSQKRITPEEVSQTLEQLEYVVYSIESI